MFGPVRDPHSISELESFEFWFFRFSLILGTPFRLGPSPGE